jgi:enoyl-[acyl-carrier-protein] reductase (NADH)
LDLAVQKENIVVEATNMVKMIKPIVSVKPRILQRGLAHIVAKVLKHADSNFTFTYLGRVNLDEKVMERIEDFNFRSWTDFGECNIAALDLNGTLIMNVCENYKNKSIIPEFIECCKREEIYVTETSCFSFEQANYRDKM